MTSQRISLITLAVSDLERAKQFYEALGFEASETTDKIAFYQMNGQYFALYSKSALEEDIDQSIPKATGAATLATNYPDKASVDAAFETAIQAGATMITKPAAVFWGGYSGYFSDPDGHMWELAFNPFWSFDKEGNLDFSS